MLKNQEDYYEKVVIQYKGKEVAGKRIFDKGYLWEIPDILCELDSLKRFFPKDIKRSIQVLRVLYTRYYPGYVWNEYDVKYLRTSLKLMNDFLDGKKGSDNQFMSLLGPSNVGKTYGGTAFYLWLYLMNPTKTKVVLTSTTVDSTRQRVWTDFLNRFRDVKKHYPKIFNDKDWRITDSKQNMTLKFKDSDNRCVVSATSLNNERDEMKTVDSMIGIHETWYFIFIDEATSCSNAIHKAKKNLAKNILSHIQLSGNPNDPHNLLGYTARPNGGWEKLDWDNTISYRNNYGIHLYFNPLKSPAIINPDPEVRRKLADVKFPTLESIKVEADLIGEDHPDYQRFILGRIQLTEKDSGILSSKYIDMYNALQPIEFSPYTNITKVAGFDPSMGYNHSDKSCFIIARIGTATDGYNKICFGAGNKRYLKYLSSSASAEYPPLYQMAMKARDICKEEGVKPQLVGVDIKPLGIKDIIHREWSKAPLIIDGGSTPDDKTGKLPPGNKISECYLQFKEFVEAGLIGGIPESILKFLAARRWEEKSGKMFLESKEKFKERTKLSSPDLLDAMVFCLDTAIRRADFKLQDTKAKEVNKKKQDYNLLERKQEDISKKPAIRFPTNAIRRTSFRRRR